VFDETTKYNNLSQTYYTSSLLLKFLSCIWVG